MCEGGDSNKDLIFQLQAYFSKRHIGNNVLEYVKKEGAYEKRSIKAQPEEVKRYTS